MIAQFFSLTALLIVLQHIGTCFGNDATELQRFMVQRRLMDALAVAAPGYPGVGPKRSLIESLLTAEHGPGFASPSYGGPLPQADARTLLHRALATVLKREQRAISESGSSNAPRTLEVQQELSHSVEPTPELKASSSSSTMTLLPDQAGVLPAGQCYCRFDYDWSEWSLSDSACKAALYQRSTDPLSGLARVWLDDYYHYKPTEGGVLLPPNADQISAFLYSDCTPAPPCSCLDIEGGDKSQACHSEIQIYAADPTRGVPAGVLEDAVADGREHTSEIHTWIRSAFPVGICDNYPGEPYVYAPLKKQKSAWVEAWSQVTGFGASVEIQPTFIIRATLSAFCALAVLASLLIVKKLVQPPERPTWHVSALDQP